MEQGQFDSEGMPADDTPPEDASTSEDPRPDALKPQEMPAAESDPVPPRQREQALPEKDDDRFFDRWVVDKARALGARAVKDSAVAQLKKTVRAFAEWRSLRHKPNAERENLEDRALVASTPEKIRTAEAEASRLEASAERAERSVRAAEQEAEESAERLAALRPALRGSTPWDLLLTLGANAVVLGADFYIIQLALETIPASPEEHRFTAILLGGGAVVVGDVIGWIAAVGSIRRDGSIQRPSRLTIAGVTALLALAVLFFGLLGDFREVGIRAAQEGAGVKPGEPGFLTIAQILFTIAAAIVFFAYFGRRGGREMQETHAVATEKLTAAKSEVSSLRQEAELARRTAANAPAECLAAKERIRSRDRIAQGRAKQDLQQGRYLESLVDPEYMRERAGVESGIVFWWIRTKAGETNLPLALAVAAAVVTTFAAGGLTYLASDNAMTAVMVGVVVAGGFVAYWWTRQPETPEHEQTWRYVARLFGSARRGGERATDIEGLTPFDPTRPRSNGNGRRNGSGNGRRRTRDELEAMNARAREALDGDGNGEEKEK